MFPYLDWLVWGKSYLLLFENIWCIFQLAWDLGLKVNAPKAVIPKKTLDIIGLFVLIAERMMGMMISTLTFQIHILSV